jgi:hypothetical protein
MERTMTLPVKREAAGTLTPGTLIRRSGLLAIAAGAYLIILPFIHPSDEVGIRSAAWVPVHLGYFAALILQLMGLIGIFARQFERAGRLGVAGFALAFAGTAMAMMEGREHLFSPDFGQGELRGLWQLLLTAVIFSVGYSLFGASIARARVLPRAAGLLLAVGSPIVAFGPPIAIPAVIIVGHTLFGAGLLWAGYALLTGAERD